MNTNKKIIYGLYDFANSGYVIMFQSFLFPLYLYDNGGTTSEWASLLLISNLVAILFAPFIGRIADLKDRVNIFFYLIVAVILFCSFSLLTTKVAIIFLTFLICNISFELTQSIYDSFLNYLSDNKNEKISISSFAWGFGYLGGVLSVLLYFVLNKFQIEKNIILIFCLGLYSLFSLLSVYMLKHVKKGTQISKQPFKFMMPDRITILNLFIYLVIFVAISSTVNFSSTYFKQELHIDEKIVGGIMLMGQVLAFPLTIFMGNLAKKYRIKQILQISILIWILSMILLYFANSVSHIVAVVVLLSFVIGTTPSLIRAHFALTVKNENMSEQYGYYGVANKSGSVFAPLIVTTVLAFSNNFKTVYLIIFILLLLTFILSYFIKQDDK